MTDTGTADASAEAVERFIGRWQAAGGTERANYQLFLTELGALLDLPTPDPASDDTRDNAYVFERRVHFRHGDGTESFGFIDLYRRGCFVLEAKKVRQSAMKSFDEALLRARSQAESYARALPADEGRPPFLVVVDVGHVIELYSDFSRSGATYVPFPDPRSHRIRLDHLRDATQRARLRQVWLDPLALDPSRQSARVTREIAERLARIARALEASGCAPDRVAGFLSRCLFTFFAEDVELIPKRSFADLLDSLITDPSQFVPMVGELWRAMDEGRFSVALRATLPRFNGKLFKDPEVLPLIRDQITLLREAAKSDWQFVEPAIFGTLLERALDPRERHALGAHFTPRAYVERLVLPTVIEPLREEWRDVQAAALTLAAEGKDKEARSEIRAFQQKLCGIRVLDPACGSGNFLYVALEHLKRLEGEVLMQREALGVSLSFEAEGLTVDPHQFLGIEINPRAAAIAELVLWIGYLQWHFRTRGHVLPSQPVLRDFHNIECRDAVLAYDGIEPVLDEHGRPVTRWDGHTTKKHPVTGEDVPDDTARVPLVRYLNPRKADWPTADFVVGNPPFIGTSNMRRALGDGYVDALRATWDDVPESADFVMYWWHHAAELTSAGHAQRFGLITTNSLRQTFNRRVIERHLANSRHPLSLLFAIPDHPWADSADGAAVRIAMTVGGSGTTTGRLLTVVGECADDNETKVELDERRGLVHADLRVGANVIAAQSLRANSHLSSPGVKLHGSGFIVTPEEASRLGLGSTPGLEEHIRPYRNGRDLASSPRGVMVIDLFGLDEEDVRTRFPATYQWVRDRVKPDREAIGYTKDGAGYARLWWLHGKPRPELRSYLARLLRYIVTVETTKHRTFQFLESQIRPDNMLIAVASDDAFVLGVLSGRVHTSWALAAGGRLGVGNDPRYNKTRCFEPFPFPDPTETQRHRVRDLAEQLDAHRKRQQAAHPTLTLTGMYNALEKLKTGEPLSEKERVIHEQGLVSVLKQLHDDLDLAVLDAYGWSDLAPRMQIVNGNAAPTTTRDDAARALDEALLERLVALNAERVAEEKSGLIRWLRPEFQNPSGAAAQTQRDMDMEEGDEEPGAVAAAAKARPWPKDLTEQVRAVASLLADAPTPLNEDDIAAHFTGRGAWRRRLPQLLEMLTALGRARELPNGRYAGSA
jgi:hypothetical protein